MSSNHKCDEKTFHPGEILWNKCTENPCHEQFIPVSKFKRKDLPEQFRKKQIMKSIKLQILLTVRIIVKIDNSIRPLNIRSHSQFGRQIQMGTGTVVEVINKEGKRGALIRIKTACHVVFSDQEAQNTTVDLFYDDKDDLEKVIQLKNFKMHCSNVEEDWSVIECFTDDKKLAQLLKSSLRKFSRPTKPLRKSENLAIIVSHPHGLSKHISLGQWSLVEKETTAKPTHLQSSLCEKKHYFWITEADFPPGYYKIKYIIDVGNDIIDSMTLAANSLKIVSIYSSGDLIFIMHYRGPQTTIFQIAYFNQRSYYSTIVNKDKKKSEAVAIECDVDYPDGTSGTCQIWRFDRPVKETKLFLMSEANIIIPEDELYLELELPDGQTQIMDDNKDIDHYWDDLSCSFKIVMKRR